jgi:hypothetical protein
MFGGVMLDDALETEWLQVPFAAIAIEELLAQRLRMRFDLGVKDPLHVFQRQFLRERTLWRVNRRRFSDRPRSSSLLGDLSIESVSNVEERVYREARAVVSRHLLVFAPIVLDGFVCVPGDLDAERGLHFLPFLVDAIPSFFFRGQRRQELLLFLAFRALGFPESFGFSPLCQEARFEALPGVVIQPGDDVYGSLE